MSGPIGSSQWMYSSGSASFFSHTIDQSLRFEEGAGSYLKRDITSSSNMKTWTWSAWVKRANLDNSHGHQYLFTDGKSSSLTSLIFNSSDQLYAQLRAGGSSKYKLTNQVFRDVSAWYHFVWRVDTTQATAEDRSRVYVNGTQITSWSTEQNVNQNTDSTINQSGNDHQIGGYSSGTSRNFDGYMAEINFIDGTSYGPETFGETKDGVWVPKAVSGVLYGTNGFHLTFADSSAIGDDLSGNTNDFTASNLAATDVVPDSPTNNFATLNSIEKDVGATFTEGNLEVTTGAGFDLIRSTFFVSSGKWYWEVRATDCGTGFIGVSTASDTGRGGQDSNQSAMLTTSNGNIRTNATSSSYGNSVSDEDIIGVALDMDNGKLYFAENNTYYNSGDPANQTNPAVTGLTTEVSPSISLYDAEDYNINFGQDSTFAGLETAGGNSDANGIGNFKYAPPSGFLALCTSNLPDPTIGPGQSKQADDHFNTVLYTGNNSASRGITGVGFAPDWVWTKSRNSGSYHHQLHDSVRGASAGALYSSLGNNQDNSYPISSFDSDGFTTSSGSQNGQNTSNTYVGWFWKAGGAPTTDNSNAADAEPTAGSVKIDGVNKSGAFGGSPDIPVTRLSANTEAGFSIVKYAGVTANPIKIPHGLTSAPELLIIKRLDGGDSWMVGEPSLGFTSSNILRLEESSVVPLGNIVFTASPDTNVFTVGSATNVNSNTSPYIAYCFHSVEGYSKFGSYEGNSSSTDGPFVFTGFRPAFIIGKNADASGRWWMYDNKRTTFNDDSVENGRRLQANATTAESTSDSSNKVLFFSNGFQVNTGNSEWNTGNTYLYFAFAEAPFKFSNAR